MQWSTVLWIAIAIVAIFVMARGCGGMMGGMRGGGCGMPRRRNESNHQGQGSKDDESKTGKAA